MTENETVQPQEEAEVAEETQPEVDKEPEMAETEEEEVKGTDPADTEINKSETVDMEGKTPEQVTEEYIASTREKTAVLMQSDDIPSEIKEVIEEVLGFIELMAKKHGVLNLIVHVNTPLAEERGTVDFEKGYLLSLGGMRPQATSEIVKRLMDGLPEKYKLLNAVESLLGRMERRAASPIDILRDMLGGRSSSLF